LAGPLVAGRGERHDFVVGKGRYSPQYRPPDIASLIRATRYALYEIDADFGEMRRMLSAGK
jgi:hypothetical protein